VPGLTLLIYLEPDIDLAPASGQVPETAAEQGLAAH
jgi:hypothetical protein